jgi:hypothetical protein
VLVDRDTAPERLMTGARDYSAVAGDHTTILYLRTR